jgi:SAM-dependent methyltransferase
MQTNDQPNVVAVPAPDWRAWLQRWDAQQTGYLPDREGRFAVMLDILEALLPERFVAVDLCCGPGSISQRLLARFSEAHCIAVDLDPVLLAIGRGLLGDAGGRLKWVESNLLELDQLAEQLGAAQVDAVLSTTALHWLPVEHLVRLYRRLAEIVRPGGVLLNGDHLRFGPDLPTFQQVAERITEQRRAEAFQRRGVEDWQQWWAAVAAEPGFQKLLAERERRFAWRPDSLLAPTAELHEAALRDAGFREVGVIWQNLHNRVVLAIR